MTPHPNRHPQESEIVAAIKSGLPYKAIQIDFNTNSMTILRIKKRNNMPIAIKRKRVLGNSK